eukprot:379446_1
MKKSGKSRDDSQPESKLVEVDELVTRSANLQLLKEKDPSVKSIICQASYVTVYVFNADLKQWARKDVEGTLFFVRRSNSPEYQLIVLNRLNASNMIQPITGSMKFKLIELYLMYTSPDPCYMGEETSTDAHGIWFHSEDERLIIFREMQRLVKAAAQRGKGDDQYSATLQQSQAKEKAAPVSAGGGTQDIKTTQRRHSGQQQQYNQYAATAEMPQPQHDEGMLLGVDQLKDTLKALIDNDRFIAMLHSQYRHRVLRGKKNVSNAIDG